MLLAVVFVASTVTAGVAAAGPDERSGDLVAVDGLPPEWDAGAGRVLTYRTEDAHGRPALARGLLLVPDGPAPAGGWPIISWDHGASGLGKACGLTSSVTAPVDLPYLRRLTGLGYGVVATDYLGLSAVSDRVHPYLNTRTEATATIDIVRAARQADDELSADWAVFGVSQGGHAALSTGSLAASYAPELSFHGTAALAPGSQIDRLIGLAGPYVPNGPLLDDFAVLAAAMLAGMRGDPAGFDLEPYLSADGRQVLQAISTECQPGWARALGGRPMGALLSRSLHDAEFARAAAEYAGLPAAGYDRPIFVAQGLLDTSVPLPMTLALLHDFDRAGTRYEFRTFAADHQGIMRDGFDAGVRFLQRILPAG
ncbi:lipase family protein [Nocardia tenerifensis]|uniref:lipase family protein n=1 Tax=Nocardia tenerifensis TaxID=228006 RepID=UPI0005945199|nr:lipase family protein [Nocardia tenerifensis]